MKISNPELGEVDEIADRRGLTPLTEGADDTLITPAQALFIETARINIDQALKVGRKTLEASGVKDVLTDAQTRILDLISRGEEVDSIMEQTGLTNGQVRYQRAQILEILAARNMTQAVRNAHQSGILLIEPSDKFNFYREAFIKLSPRELEVTHLASEGFTESETATRLDKSVKTVKNQRQNSVMKFGFTHMIPVVRALCEIGYYPSPSRERILLVEVRKLLNKAQRISSQLVTHE